ncbi:MAG: hypothetical protein RBU25_10965 [Lentisphaeria bacterium]|jgi:hypothetical protein|nr:hypothetical protein [Lentisphaeria bacterium]
MNRYVEAAVDSEIQALRSTSSGRACAAFKAAAAIGGFVGAGEVDRSVAECALLSAALETGLPEREAAGHIRRGILRGAKTPRTVPETVCHRNIKFRAPRFARPTALTRSEAGTTPVRPPKHEVAALWAASQHMNDAPEATAWFTHRYGSAAAWSLQQADQWDLARALPAGLRLPRWARSQGGPWSHTGHRIIIRLWDHTGEAVSLRARSTDTTVAPKSLAPTGYSVKGLVLADPLAQQLLGGVCPTWWQPRQVIVAEGEPDWLLWALRQRETDEQGPAVLGIESGAWSPQIAARIPTGASVVIRTHHDEPGERYAQQIAASLHGRCRIFRSSAGKGVPR